MKVKSLIENLLNMPMDSEVNIVYVDENYDYNYQDIFSIIKYEDENLVGLIGVYENEV